MDLRRDSSETKRKILTVCVRLFLEQGYKNTSVSQIVDEAGVARGSYLNLFPTKDKILLDLTETMFGGQFGMARSIADIKLPPVYAYAVETAIQLTLTELNENLREIYIEAYSLPETSEYIYLHTTAELKQIFSANFPDYSDSDFYEMEIGTAGLMRNYMARKCDIHFPLERKLSRFLTAAMRVYRVPEDELEQTVRFVERLDIRSIAERVMHTLFQTLAMHYDFSLQEIEAPLISETEETT
jgi:AcrR family transcriptional regulator